MNLKTLCALVFLIKIPNINATSNVLPAHKFIIISSLISLSA